MFTDEIYCKTLELDFEELTIELKVLASLILIRIFAEHPCVIKPTS